MALSTPTEPNGFKRGHVTVVRPADADANLKAAESCDSERRKKNAGRLV
jgi:hypothetical protein